MSRLQAERVIAVIDWRAAATLKDNAAFLRRAGLLATSRPRRRARGPEHRSLVVRADGSGELQRFTATTVARRLAAGNVGSFTVKAGTERRG